MGQGDPRRRHQARLTLTAADASARGDVFVCRHAGNFADEETIASFEYGVAVLNVPLLMVLGLERLRCHRFHHQIDQGQHHPARPSAGASARLTPAVQAAQGKPSDLPANAIRANVAMKVDRLKTTAPILKAAFDDNKLRVVGGVYNLKTGRVDLLLDRAPRRCVYRPIIACCAASENRCRSGTTSPSAPRSDRRSLSAMPDKR